MVRLLIARPLPEQVGHGSSTMSPRPRHVLQGSENAKLPRFLLAWPDPSHVGQTLGTVPDFAPVPWHTGHGPSPVSRSGTVTPVTASLNESVASVSTSAPRRGRCCVPRPPNMPPSRSPSRPPVPDDPNRSPRSKPKPPPPAPPGVPTLKRSAPNRVRASSYSLRRFSSDSTLYASEISLKRSSALGSPLLASGWNLRASLRYDCLISSAVAVFLTARTL